MMEINIHEWKDKSAYILPGIPESMLEPEFAALLHMVAFIELSGDSAIDPVASAEALENVCVYLSRIKMERLRQIQKQLELISVYGQKMGWSGDAIEFVEGFLENCGVFDEKT